MQVCHSNQVSYEVTDAVGSYVPVMNVSTNEMIYEMNHILTDLFIMRTKELTNDQPLTSMAS